MENISDRNGRALEYVVTEKLRETLTANLTERAETDQERDRAKYQSLPAETSMIYEQGANRIADFIVCGESMPLTEYTIDRLPDEAAKKGDVTDIRIIRPDRTELNLSIKHNHHASKHQRPSALMQQIGFAKDSPEDSAYRQNLGEIFSAFHTSINDLPAGTYKRFSDLKQIDSEFINRCLYAPVCALACNELNRHLADFQRCQSYFSFLVGRTNFLKVILLKENIEFQDFSQIPLPQGCIVSIDATKPNYVYLAFDNGWKLSMRLHTASEFIEQTPSLKFDTQLIETTIPTTTYPL